MFSRLRLREAKKRKNNNEVFNRRTGGSVPVRVHIPGTVRVHGGTEKRTGRQGTLSAGDALGHGQDDHGAVADRGLHGQVSSETGQTVVQHPHAVRNRKGRGRVARVVRLLPGEQVRYEHARRGAVVPQEPVRKPVGSGRTQRAHRGRAVSRVDGAVRPGPARRGRPDRRRVRLLRKARFAGPGHGVAARHLQRRRPERVGRQAGRVPVFRRPANARTRQRRHIQLPLFAGPENRRHCFQRFRQEHGRRVRRGPQHRHRLHRLVEFAHHEQQSGQGDRRPKQAGRGDRDRERAGLAEADRRIQENGGRSERNIQESRGQRRVGESHCARSGAENHRTARQY